MLLNWIRRRLFNRHRHIYRYWDGRRALRDDPIRLFRDLMSHPDFEWDQHIEFIDNDDEMGAESRAITLKAIRDTFRVQAFDPETGKGLTEDETFGLLWAFISWCNAKKKPTNPSPTPPASMERESWVESTTKPSSDSGSTSPESKFDTPRA